MNSLPIEAVLPELLQVLAQKNAVLVAPPGAGKTTGVPLALLQESWLRGKKIYLLEPRRVAARRAAYYLAACLGEKVGQTVGYRMRRDTKVGKETRLEVITEGILTRLLQQDESLSDCGIVIFDEFHERNIHADLGLALCLESQKYLREDLRLLVMSATLTAEPVAALLGNSPILVSEGKAFPVRTVYLTKRQVEPLSIAVSKAVEQALCEENGDILVFLPGVREIREAQVRLQRVDPDLYIAPLYGALPQAEQDAAIHPAAGGARKVILATSIAETSLTVEGVRVVIDAGLMRIPQFSARRALTNLTTVRVTQDAADQRRGRAGRLAPGVCYRLWTMEEQNHLIAKKPAEILESDLTFLVLELALWGVNDATQLTWLDPPPSTAYEQAVRLLQELGALDEKRKITEAGRRLAEMGTEPRLARMILAADQDGSGQTACRLAALLNERESLWNGFQPERTDIRRQLDALSEGGEFVNSAVRRRILNEADFLARALIRRSAASERDKSSESYGFLLALAFPDRVAQRRNDGRFLLRSGRGAIMANNEAELKQADYLAVAELDDRGVDAKILLAAPLTAAEIEKIFVGKFSIVKEVKWDRTAQAVRAKKYQKLGAFIIKEQVDAAPDPALITKTLIEGIQEEGLKSLPWSKEACQLVHRLRFLRYHQGDSWPDGSAENLLATLEVWLGPYLSGMTAAGDWQRLNLRQILTDQLSWQQKKELDQLAPSHWTAPSGQKIMIDYEKPESPSVAVKLQAVFGLAATPCILAGKVPLTLALLSPAQRPVQVTRDLGNFWQNTYFEVKKELMGRYPKHYWPEDPQRAVPTARVRPPAVGKAKENGNKKH